MWYFTIVTSVIVVLSSVILHKLCQGSLSHLISRVGEAKSTELAISDVIETVPPVASILQDYFY